MNKTVGFGALAALSLIMIIASRGLTVSDFISGLILGLGITMEIVALIGLLKTAKKNK